MRVVSKATFTTAVAVLVAGISILTPSPALAQDTSFRATLYGYVPSLAGETAFPTPLGNTFDINAETLIDNTDFAMMGLFEVQKGRIGGFADVMYFDIGKNTTAMREVTMPGAPGALPITANTALDLKAWVAEAALNIRALKGRAGTFDVFGGTRRLELTGGLDYAFTSPIAPGPQGTAIATNTNWDAIGGVRGRLYVGPFAIPYYADAGAGDSDLTWQVMAGIGYEFPHVDVGVVWRHLDYRMTGDRKLANLELSGPTAGISVKW